MHSVTQQIHTELHSVHGPETNTQPTGGSFTVPTPCEKPADEVIDLLTREMEHMVIESHLADGGPLKSAVDHAVQRRRAKKELELKPPMKRTDTGMLSPTPSPPPEAGRVAMRRLPSSALKTARTAVGNTLSYVRARSQSL